MKNKRASTRAKFKMTLAKINISNPKATLHQHFNLDKPATPNKMHLTSTLYTSSIHTYILYVYLISHDGASALIINVIITVMAE